MTPERKKTLRGWLRTKGFPPAIIGTVLKWAEEWQKDHGELSDQSILAEAEAICEKLEALSAQLHPSGEKTPVELVIQKLSRWEIAQGVFFGGLLSFAFWAALGFLTRVLYYYGWVG